MSLRDQSTLRVILYEGEGAQPLDAADCFSALTSLLERGYAATRTSGERAVAPADGGAVLVLGRFAEGVPEFHGAEKVRAHNLANALHDQDKHAEAEREYRDVLTVRERVLGKDHPDVFQTAANLALALESQGRFEEALVFAQRAEEGRRRVFGEEHPDSQEAGKLREKIAAALAKEKADGPASGTEGEK